MAEATYDQVPTATKKPIIKNLENNGKRDFVYKTAQKSLRLVIEKIWGDKFKIRGLENIPTTGPAIIAVNHPSHIDEEFLIAAIDRPMHFVGRQDREFNPTIVRISYPLFGVVSLPKNIMEGSKRFVRQVEEIVKNKELICLFPEKLYVEDRENKEETGEFAPGVVYLAKKYNLPIIPVYLSGTQNVRPDSQATRLFQPIHIKPVEIAIGKPITLGEIQNAEQIRQAILGLKNS